MYWFRVDTPIFFLFWLVITFNLFGWWLVNSNPCFQIAIKGARA